MLRKVGEPEPEVVLELLALGLDHLRALPVGLPRYGVDVHQILDNGLLPTRLHHPCPRDAPRSRHRFARLFGDLNPINIRRVRPHEASQSGSQWYSTSGADSGGGLTPNRTARKPCFS